MFSLLAEYAFLRSAPHTNAMCTCIQAFEKRDLQLLSQIDNVLVRTVNHKEKRIFTLLTIVQCLHGPHLTRCALLV